MLFRNNPKPSLPEPPVSAYGPTGDPDLRGVGRILWRKKTLILGVTLASAAVAFVAVNAVTPRYRSEARLLLEVRENVFLRANADRSGDRTAVEVIEASTL